MKQKEQLMNYLYKGQTRHQILVFCFVYFQKMCNIFSYQAKLHILTFQLI